MLLVPSSLGVDSTEGLITIKPRLISFRSDRAEDVHAAYYGDLS